ncbi:MAG: pitrilysin family protein [Myxococcota bacterium]|nr:pitrilysin family protein [Myxococcota bacterium]
MSRTTKPERGTRLPKSVLALLAGLSLGCSTLLPPPSNEPASLDIEYQEFVLDNGLTLIVHTDRKAPIVAVNVWYHVGSKNERPGKTGFAHLFEHLMFNGSENYDDDYFGPFDRVGATDMNGTTNSDRTNYFQNVPTNALDMALFMESDRMGHLLGAIDQEKLDEQRGVVQNEKRQGENQPYGKVFRLLTEQSYPGEHPYSWSTIGSMEDLDAASLEDVQEWFKAYYGAANAVIAVAGDVDAEEVRARVERYFGDIPSGPPIERQQAWIAKRTGEQRMIAEDRVPQGRVLFAWNVPAIGTADGDYLDLLSTILAQDKSSPLYKRLVYEDQIATDVTAFVWLREIGGIFVVWATAAPGQSLAHVESVLEAEIEAFLERGPTATELAVAQVQHRSAFLRGIERIGGFGGKSDILARSKVLGGSPDAYRTSLDRMAAADPQALDAAAKRWLTDGRLVMEIRPYPTYGTKASDVDRTKFPSAGEPPKARFPSFERAELANGLQLILARRDAIPVVDVELLVDAGYAADQFSREGTASLALSMLDEGTEKRSSLEISQELSALGAKLSTGSNLDVSSVSLSALVENLDESLDIFADVILNPAFDLEEFERLKRQQLAAIQREKVTPRSMALRVFPRLLYGKGHAYGISFTGSGTEESVAGITTDQLRDFHQSWFRPNHAVLVIVGDTTLAEIRPKLDALFAGWQAGEAPEKNVGQVELPNASAVYLVDRPGSLQSILFAGHLAPPKANPNEISIEAMNEVLGGSFSARINMNLREEKHWSYGARSFFFDAQGQRPFIAYAPVQTDKTADSMLEIQKEISDITTGRPPAADERDRAIDKKTLTLPGRWETGSAVGNSIAQMVRFGFPDDYWDQYPAKMREQTAAQLGEAARQVLHPDRLTWVVVGDRAEIEAGIRAAGFGPLHLVDADGNAVESEGEAASAR